MSRLFKIKKGDAAQKHLNLPNRDNVLGDLHPIPGEGSATNTDLSDRTVEGGSEQIVVSNVSYVTEGVTRKLSEVTTMIPLLEAARDALQQAINLPKNLMKSKDEWTEFIQRVSRHHNLLASEIDDISIHHDIQYARDHRVEEAVMSYLRRLENMIRIGQTSVGGRKKITGVFKTPMLGASGVQNLTSNIRDLDDAFQDFLQLRPVIPTSRPHSSTPQPAIGGSTEPVKKTRQPIDAILLIKFKEAPIEARGNDLECASGTRQVILNRLRIWGENISETPRVFLLSDVAGSGKTTVASHMAKEWLERGLLLSQYYFSSDDDETKNTRLLCGQMARDIIQLHPSSQEILSATFSDVVSITNWKLSRQFHLVVTETLRQIRKDTSPDTDHSPMILIFDALDQCADRHDFVTVLLSELAFLPFVKILLTTRPDPTIDVLLRESDLVGGLDVSLYIPEDPNGYKDIEVYMEQLLPNTVPKDQRQQLIKRTGGLFVFAATACQQLRQVWIDDSTFPELMNVVPGDLSLLYINILKQALPNNVAIRYMKAVLGVIIVARRRVSIATIERFLPDNDKVGLLVDHLGSVMKDGTPYRPIHLLHATFKEFISDQTRADKYYIPTVEANLKVAIRCLEILLEELHCDLLHILEDGQPVPTKTSSSYDLLDQFTKEDSRFIPVLYALRFWPDHTRKVLREPNVQTLLKRFLEEKLLFWIEWIGIFQLLPDILRSLQRLQDTIASIQTLSVIEKYGLDLRQFLQENQPMITNAFLQVYTSGISFTPKDSIFQTHLKKYSPRCLPVIVRGRPKGLSAVRVLSGHTSAVEHCEYSSDGAYFVTSGRNGSIRMWDSLTGGCVAVLSIENRAFQTEEMKDFKYSKDGRFILSGRQSTDGAKLWSASTHRKVGMMDLDYETLSRSDISPDSTKVVTACAGGAVIVWAIADDLSHRRLWYKWLHKADITVAIFSPDSKTLLTGSNDGTLYIWDADTGKVSPQSPIKTDCNFQEAIFCNNGARVIATSTHKSVIHTWEMMADGLNECLLEEHSETVLCLSVSDDTTVWASGARGGDILLWDARSNTCRYPPLIGSAASVYSLCFSRDGTKVAAGAYRGPVRVWDIEDPAHPCIKILEGATYAINCVRISPSGTQILAVSEDRQVRLWNEFDTTLSSHSTTDAATPDHNDPINILKFSPDGTKIAVASGADANSQIRLWDSGTGDSIGTPLKGHRGLVSRLTFTSDGTHLLSGSEDCSVRVWNIPTLVSTGKVKAKHIFKGHSTAIRGILMLQDGQHVISAEDSLEEDNTLILWDISGANMWKLDGHGPRHDLIAQSPDGRLIVSCSSTNGLGCISILASVQTVTPFAKRLQLSDTAPNHAAFGAAWKYLVSGTMHIKIWDLSAEPVCVGSFSVDYSHRFLSKPIFSGNGDFITFDHRAIDVSALTQDSHGNLKLVESEVAGSLEVEHPLFYGSEQHAIKVAKYETSILMLPQSFQLLGHKLRRGRAWASHRACIALGSQNGNLMILRWDGGFI